MTTVPECETCGGERPRDSRAQNALWDANVNAAHLAPCPECRGTGDAGVPVILPAEIAAHLPALLRVVLRAGFQDWRDCGITNKDGLWLTLAGSLEAWLEAQP